MRRQVKHSVELVRLSAMFFVAVLGVGQAAGQDQQVALDIKFLEGEAAADMMVDETYHPYFELLRPVEMRARVWDPLEAETAEAMRQEVRQRYRDSVEPFTEEEKQAVREGVEAVDEVLGDRWPQFSRRPWRFVKFADILGELPHTRGDAIAMPQGMLAAMVNADGNERRARFMQAILVHEQAHVVQRLDQEAFNTFYEETWGFHEADAIGAPESLTQHILTNPDGVNINWVLPVEEDDGETRWVWPMLVLQPNVENPVMPRHLQFITIDVERAEGNTFEVITGEDGEAQYRPLTQDEGYQEAIAASHNNYHPNEIMAAFMQDTFSAWQIQQDEDTPDSVLGAIDDHFTDHAETLDWLDEQFSE